MFEKEIGSITSTSAWLAAGAKQFDRISKWPLIDPSRAQAIEEFAASLERAGIKLVELAEQIRSGKSD